MPAFERYIGIDYSGAKTAISRLKNLQVYAANRTDGPREVAAPDARHWSREGIARYCLAAVSAGEPVVVGLDHGFSFPATYLQRYRLRDWDGFLEDFVRHWPGLEGDVTVESLRAGNRRTGEGSEFRLCELWTATAKSVFRFGMQGSVAKSTHAGIPWLRWLRKQTRGRVHFWPFDGFEVPGSRSVVAEVYPSLLRRRYAIPEHMSPDQRDAWAVAQWLCESDRHDRLARYLEPPLTVDERERAVREGWILGVW